MLLSHGVLEYQVGGDQVPGGVIQPVGEHAQGVFGGPATAAERHQPRHLCSDVGFGGRAQCRELSAFVEADADGQHSSEVPGPSPLSPPTRLIRAVSGGSPNQEWQAHHRRRNNQDD